jgi:hypothetical protein
MEFQNEISTIAVQHGLDTVTVAGLIEVESGFNPWAWNPEPRYRYYWNLKTNLPFRKVSPEEATSETPPRDFPTLVGDPDQEWWAQSVSWGLMQLMGAVARERGFTGRYLTQLVDPKINITFGCMQLVRLLQWSKGNLNQALAAYNGGMTNNSRVPFQNQSYADKVLAAIARQKEGQ